MGVPVVICCAAEDERTIAPVLAALGKDGHSVELLPGVEDNADLLNPVVDRFHGEGLYVLCRSRALGRDAVDALRDILLAHHVPFGRTLTVASTRPRELKERIAASLRRIASGQAKRLSQVPPEGKATPKRATRLGFPAVTPAAPSRPVPVAPKPKAKRQATQMGIASVPASAPKSPPSDSPQPKDEPEAAPPPASADTFEDELPTNTQLSADEIPAPKPEPKPEAEPPPQAPVPVPRDDSLARAPVITSDELADLDLDGLELSASDLEVSEVLDGDDDWGGAEQVPVRTGTTTVAKALTPEQVADGVRTGQTDIAKAIPRSSLEAIRTGDTAIVRREDLIAAGLVDPAAESASRPLAPPPPAASPAAREGTTVEGTQASSPVPWRWIGVGAAALVLVGIVAAAASGGEDDESAEDEDPAAIASADSAEKDPASAADDAPQGDDDEPPSEAGASPAATDERTLVGEALRSREVQALDVLLVSATEGPFDYDGARTHCGDLAVQGLEQWRLPEVGELMSLTTANMTGRGYYWSATPADTFGDTPLVWHARRGRVLTRSQKNYAVCVRGGTQTG